MTHLPKAIAGGVLAVAAVVSMTACSTHTHLQAAATTPAMTSSPTTSARGASAVQAAQPDAVEVARAFTTAVCPYSYADRMPYGQRLNAALARWATPAYAASRSWSPSEVSTRQTLLQERRSEQRCGLVTGGVDPDASPTAGSVRVRLSVEVSSFGDGSPVSVGQQQFQFLLVHRGGRWVISDGQW